MELSLLKMPNNVVLILSGWWTHQTSELNGSSLRKNKIMFNDTLREFNIELLRIIKKDFNSKYLFKQREIY